MRKNTNKKRRINFFILSIIAIALGLTAYWTQKNGEDLQNNIQQEEKSYFSESKEVALENKIAYENYLAFEERQLKASKIDPASVETEDFDAGLPDRAREIDTTVRYVASDSEFELLCFLVKAERSSREHSTRDLEMVSIVATVLNRVESKEFPNTVTEVLREPEQFTPVNGGKVYWYSSEGYRPVEASDIDEDIKEAVSRALYGEDPTRKVIEDGALYYYSASYFEKLEDCKEKRIRNAITEDIQYGDTVFHRQFPTV